jgi:hypothetical protein
MTVKEKATLATGGNTVVSNRSQSTTANAPGQTVVAIYLEVSLEPNKAGIGASFARITDGTTREIGIKLYSPTLLVGRSLIEGDCLGVKFLSSLLLCEFLAQRHRLPEFAAIQSALVKQISPEPLRGSKVVTFLACEIAKSQFANSIGQLPIFGLNPADQSALWFALQVPELSPISSFWQWNPLLPKPEPKRSNGSGPKDVDQ